MTANRRSKRVVPRGPKQRKSLQRAGWVLGLGLAGTLILVSVVWWGITTVKDSLISSLVDVETTVQGTLEAVQPVQAVLVRDEQLVVTPTAGQVRKVVPEGERVRKGALLAYISEKTIETGSGVRDVPVYAPTTGIVSYNVDNLEGLATPANLEKLGGQRILKAVEEQSVSNTQGSAQNADQSLSQAWSAAEGSNAKSAAAQAVPAGGTNSSLQSGQPFCKIVNNLKPTYLLVDNSEAKVAAKLYQESRYVYGKLASQPEAVSFRVQPLSSPEMLALSSSASAPEFFQKRIIQLNLITGQFKGYIIPQGALVSENGQTGIYIVYKEIASWQPVKVKGEANGKVAVEAVEKAGTSRLSPNALVVINPSLVKDGQSVSVR